jgi:hypothetical protein
VWRVKWEDLKVGVLSYFKILKRRDKKDGG